MKPFFLAKSGRIFGPYSEQQIESLRVSGDYDRFSWVWDDSQKSWKPIDPAPIHAPQAAAQPQQLKSVSKSDEAQQPAFVAPIAVVTQDTERLSALCYDHHIALSGWIVNSIDSGCEFISAGSAATPELMTKSTIFLHLFDPSTGKAMSVSGRVGSAERRAGEWRYRIHWKRMPQILSSSQEVGVA